MTVGFFRKPKNSYGLKNSSESNFISKPKANRKSMELTHNIILGISVGSVLISLSVITGIGLAKARACLVDKKYIDV